MTTSFRIAHPDIPLRAVTIKPSLAFREDQPIRNTVRGERHLMARTSSTAAALTVTYDLGQGGSASADYFCLVYRDCLLARGVTAALLQSSADGSSWTNRLGSTTAFQTAPGLDERNTSVLYTRAADGDQVDAAPASARWWRCSFTAPSAVEFVLGKLYFGTLLDPGREPDFYTAERVFLDADAAHYPRGQVVMAAPSSGARFRVTVEYDGLPDATERALKAALLADPARNHVVLFADRYPEVLGGHRLMHALVEPDGCSFEKLKPDYNHVVLSFLELP